MKKSKSTIRGKRNMSHSNSYDSAFRLCNILRKYQNRFVKFNCDDVTVYPSSWYEGFFEIMIRNKYNPEEKMAQINITELEYVISRYVEDGWGWKVMNVTVPMKVQFNFSG